MIGADVFGVPELGFGEGEEEATLGELARDGFGVEAVGFKLLGNGGSAILDLGVEYADLVGVLRRTAGVRGGFAEEESSDGAGITSCAGGAEV